MEMLIGNDETHSTAAASAAATPTDDADADASDPFLATDAILRNLQITFSDEAAARAVFVRHVSDAVGPLTAVRVRPDNSEWTAVYPVWGMHARRGSSNGPGSTRNGWDAHSALCISSFTDLLAWSMSVQLPHLAGGPPGVPRCCGYGGAHSEACARILLSLNSGRD